MQLQSSPHSTQLEKDPTHSKEDPAQPKKNKKCLVRMVIDSPESENICPYRIPGCFRIGFQKVGRPSQVILGEGLRVDEARGLLCIIVIILVMIIIMIKENRLLMTRQDHSNALCW